MVRCVLWFSKPVLFWALCDLISKVGAPGNDWKDLVTEATTEVLKLGSSPMALLFQALLQYVTKMAARSVPPRNSFLLTCHLSSKEICMNHNTSKTLKWCRLPSFWGVKYFGTEYESADLSHLDVMACFHYCPLNSARVLIKGAFIMRKWNSLRAAPTSLCQVWQVISYGHRQGYCNFRWLFKSATAGWQQ